MCITCHAEKESTSRWTRLCSCKTQLLQGQSLPDAAFAVNYLACIASIVFTLGGLSTCSDDED